MDPVIPINPNMGTQELLESLSLEEVQRSIYSRFDPINTERAFLLGQEQL
jgi:hypothetical protein